MEQEPSENYRTSGDGLNKVLEGSRNLAFTAGFVLEALAVTSTRESNEEFIQFGLSGVIAIALGGLVEVIRRQPR